MSLWHKDMAAVTFADVEAFCAQQIPEEERLDYKGEFPKDLGKLVCAFANTRGGLILIGACADKTNNLPVWPPQGFSPAVGVEERITAICRDQIYPPVRPLISPVLENQGSPRTFLVVIRVDESPEAPHSINGKVYERTGSQGQPHRDAHIDRIERLIRKRGRVEEQREEMLQKEIGRALRKMTHSRLMMPDVPDLGNELRMAAQKYPHQRPLIPIRWASVIPLFPWRDLCKGGICRNMLETLEGVGQVQRAPGGAFGVGSPHALEGCPRGIKACFSLTTRGHVFAAELAIEVADQVVQEKKRGNKTTELHLKLEDTQQFVYRTLRFAHSFYQHTEVELPGYLQVAVGFVDVYHYRMRRPMDFKVGQPFVDESFRTEAVIPVDALVANYQDAAGPVLEDLALGFDAD